MTKLLLLLLSPIISSTEAQMADASIFPSVRPVNPGVIHLGNTSFINAQYGKETHKKNHNVPLGGIIGGINTNVELKNTSFYSGIRKGFVNAELLYDAKSGTHVQTINTETRGNRTVTDDASADYLGANIDLRFMAFGYATSDYKYFNQFRVGYPPDLSARDEDKKLKYNVLKIGTAFPISIFRFGFYYFNQKASGNYTYTYYDPTTGNKGSTEASPVTIETTGLGAGFGITLPLIRTEISYERMSKSDLSINADYPGEVSAAEASNRLSFVAEGKLGKVKLGIRHRIMTGNFVDLNDIITSNLLYEKIQSADKRNETSFNFSLGDSKGLSPSAFYTTSNVSTEETSPVFDNDLKYPATTKTTAYGVSLSYTF